MTEPTILAALRGVRRSGEGWVALCPAHDDRHASLSVSISENGRCLLKCHAGCDFNAICAALNVEPWELAPPNHTELEFRDRSKASPTRSRFISATYDYLDEHGSLVFQVVRYEPKAFLQRRPTGTGEWLYRLDGVRRVLYRLPEVIETVCHGEPLYIVEGEKDCDRLRRHGLTATCNAGGAGKWRPDYGQWLRDADVIIIPDNDEAGKKHAVAVANELQGSAKRIRLVELPGVPVKGDISDWLDLGHPIQELRAIADAAPDWSPTQDPIRARSRVYEFTTVGDLMNEPEEEIEWLVDGLLPSGGLSVLAGKPKSGKSTLARNLALSVAQGKPILGRTTHRGAVLYLALEEKRSELRKHFELLGANPEDEIFIHVGSAPIEALREIRPIIEKRKPALLIIDTLFRFIRPRDGNDYASMTVALEPVMGLARGANCHVMLVHHMPKGDRTGGDAVLGSQAIVGAVDTAILLYRKGMQRTLETNQRYGEDLSETIVEFDPEKRALSLGDTRERAEVKRIEADIVQTLTRNPGFTEGEVANEIEGRNMGKRRALRELLGQEKIRREGKGTRGSPYRYYPIDSRTLVPTICQVQENGNGKESISTDGTDPYSRSPKSWSADGDEAKAGTGVRPSSSQEMEVIEL